MAGSKVAETAQHCNETSMHDTGWMDGDDTELAANEPQPGASVEEDLIMGSDAAGRRLDQALSGLLPDFSRSRIQDWIETGEVQLDGRRAKPGTRLVGGERVCVRARLPELDAHAPEPMTLAIVYEDEDLIVIDKPAGLVVHPAAGNWSGTLLNGLLHHDPGLGALPRCGIVHRLDKDTSGLLVVARTPAAHKSLVEQLSLRSVRREYRALVLGEVTAGGIVDAPIGRHPARRTAMAVVRTGKPAVTDYQVLARYPGLALLAVWLRTGRTHQIRVHMAHIGHPLVGDPVYGVGRGAPPVGTFPRQALHAIRLGLTHPGSGERLSFEVPMAADLAALLRRLETGA
jgi:23S rRNA pseudouridine1911/1915/1917 synthase